jgi:hypothetical protein
MRCEAAHRTDLALAFFAGALIALAIGLAVWLWGRRS